MHNAKHTAIVNTGRIEVYSSKGRTKKTSRIAWRLTIGYTLLKIDGYNDKEGLF